eukprot:CAMPEP_0184091162 /NCGR_PEP_ID=MMETSP0974-20121125/7599_1 /TAXON_ID=483370 /ORGANISM="non described non described, Strain CCMP2097" /LENGTH=52 /DNA_ID=CAMNT_0026393899 /DNA_START=35 /DNA_END=189 /DNA_ORIENTATION=-
MEGRRNAAGQRRGGVSLEGSWKPDVRTTAARKNQRPLGRMYGEVLAPKASQG